jgi:hypothetical protein
MTRPWQRREDRAVWVLPKLVGGGQIAGGHRSGPDGGSPSAECSIVKSAAIFPAACRTHTA